MSLWTREIPVRIPKRLKTWLFLMALVGVLMAGWSGRVRCDTETDPVSGKVGCYWYGCGMVGGWIYSECYAFPELVLIPYYGRFRDEDPRNNRPNFPAKILVTSPKVRRAIANRYCSDVPKRVEHRESGGGIMSETQQQAVTESVDSVVAPPVRKLYISNSQLEMFCRCPESYRRRYIEGERLPPGIAAVKGTAVHGGAAVNFTQKMETRQDLPVSDIVDAAVAAFEAETHGELAFTREETSRGIKAVIGDAKDAVADMATVHATEQAPDYQPVLVEAKVRIELPNAPRDLLGVIDLADEQGRVVDFKTSGKRKAQNEVDSSVQLTIYAAAHEAVTGTPTEEVRLDTLVQLKRGTERQVLTSTRNEHDFRALANRASAVMAAIDAGNFTPAIPGAWWCSAKWCGFWSSCKFVNPNRKTSSDE